MNESRLDGIMSIQDRAANCIRGDCGRNIASADADKWLAENMKNVRISAELFEALEFVIEGMVPPEARLKHGREVLHKYKADKSVMLKNAGWPDK